MQHEKDVDDRRHIPNVLRVKCAVIGDPCVGKTSLLSQVISDGKNFPKNYLLTPGADLTQKAINIPDTKDAVELYFLDSSGRESLFGSFLEELWAEEEDMGLVALVYDVTNEKSFQGASEWMERLLRSKETGEGKPSMPGVLIANKCDLKARRVISPKQGSELASKLSLVYFETSSKDYSGVEEPFYYLANEWYKLYNEKAEVIVSNGL